MPPAVVATIPRDGAVEVSPTAPIRIVFSEPITTNGGRVELSAGDAVFAIGTPSLSADARELTVTPAELAGNTAITARVEGYRDLAGNAMAAAHTFTFTTSDPFAPAVVVTAPTEGATGVAVDTAVIDVLFSEPMITTLGVAELSGGPGTLGAPTWEGARARFPVSGLAADTAYRLTLSGYADAAGNALDASAYLGDGALDFTTGADIVAPFVTEATPSEGQTAVPPSRTTRVSLVFSEPMDPSAGEAALEQGVNSTPLEASWAAGDTILILDVSGLMEADLPYRVTLTGYTDAAGNALDGSVYLGDGALDYTTGEDELAPFVLYTNPAETSTGTRWTTSSLFATFSEGMDPAITEVPFTDGVSSGTFAASWSSGGTLLDIDVAGRLISGRTYELDFTGFRDAEGSPLDATHPYLGDGRLTFTTDTPRGESCQDFLTHAEATVTGQTHVWSLASLQVTNVDGAAPCDTSGGSPDAVIRYTKTSPDSTAATGGHVLRVTVTSSSTLTNKDLNVQVLRDACDPTSAPPATLTCRANANPHTFDLDVPAGEYFVWVAASSGLDFRGATVSIEEIPAGLGDTCRNAIPITAGTTAIAPSGTRDLFAPSCTSGALTWYRYTASERLGLVTLDAPRAIAGMDGTTLEPMQCRADAVTQPIPVIAEIGSDACIAVGSGTAATITIEEHPYGGVRGVTTVLPMNRPTGVASVQTAGWMAVQGSTLFRGQANTLALPTRGGDLAQVTLPSSVTNYGGAAVTRPDGLYVTSSSTATTGSRLLRITDPSGALLTTPVEIDVLPAGFEYPARRFDALTWDGTRFLTATAQATTAQANPTCCDTITFWAIPTDGTTPVQIGSNDFIDDVSALAADSTFIYVYGRSGNDEAIWRLRRDQLTDPAQAPVELLSGLDLSNDSGSMYVDSTSDATVLYVRNYGGGAHVWAIIEPDAATPLWVGTLWRASGTRTDNGMAYDPAGPALYIVDTTSPFSSDGRWIRID